MSSSVANRIVTSFVPRTPLHGNLSRLIGGLDFKGHGTNHPLLSVDPFVLCDAAPEIVGAGKPPFGFHPHHGLIAMTYVLSGAFDDEDNLGGGQKHVNEAGSVYMVSTGRGLCHSEKSLSDGLNGVMQTIVRIPRDKLDLLPAISRATADQLPVLDMQGGSLLRLLVGSMAGLTSPVYVDALPRFVLARVEVAPGCSIQLPLDEDLEHGFVHVLQGGDPGVSSIGGHTVEAEGGAYLFEAGHLLEVSNEGAAEPLHLFLGAGAKLENEPWVKLLGHNGFIIARDEETANGVMSKIGEKTTQFTYRDLLTE